MSSLEQVNSTLKDIRDDTDTLNNNFEKWWKYQQRQRLDELEVDRERERRMRTMMASMGAAAGGTNGGGKTGGTNSDDSSVWDKLPRAAKIALMLTGIPAAIGAYRIATAPARIGNRMGERAVSAYRQYGQSRMRGQEIANARAEQARIEADVDRAGADLDRRRLTDLYLKGVRSDATAYQAFLDSQIEAKNRAATNRTLRQLGDTPSLVAPGTDTAPNLRGGADPSIPRSTSGAGDFKPLSINDIIPSLDLANRTRADLDTVFADDAEMKRTVQQVENQKKVKFVMQKNGMIAAFKVDGAGNRSIMKAPELESAINSLRAATTEVIEKKINKDKPKRRAARPRGGAAMGVAGGLLAFGGVTAEALREQNVTGSVFDPEKIGAGAFSASMLTAAGGSIGDFSDFVYGLYAAYKGEDYTGQYGQSTRELISDTGFIQWLNKQNGMQIGVGSRLKSFAAGAEGIETQIGIGAMRLARLLGGQSWEEIAAAEGLSTLKINPQQLQAQSNLLNQVTSNLQNSLPPQLNIGTIDNSVNAPQIGGAPGTVGGLGSSVDEQRRTKINTMMGTAFGEYGFQVSGGTK